MRGSPDKSRPSVVYAIEGLDDRRVYVGVTSQAPRKRRDMHKFAQKTGAAEILNTGRYVHRICETDIPWAEREAREDAWMEWYRTEGWEVLSHTRAEVRRLLSEAGLRHSAELSATARRTAKKYFTPERAAAMGAIANTRKWKCGGCSLVTTGGPLGHHQKATGHAGRTRVEIK